MLGAGAPCSLFDLYVLERVQVGEDEANIDDWVTHIGGSLDGEGRGQPARGVDPVLTRARADPARAGLIGLTEDSSSARPHKCLASAPVPCYNAARTWED